MMVLVNNIIHCQLTRQLDENMGGLEDWFFYKHLMWLECMREEGCHYRIITVFCTVSRMQNIWKLRHKQVQAAFNFHSFMQLRRKCETIY